MAPGTKTAVAELKPHSPCPRRWPTWASALSAGTAAKHKRVVDRFQHIEGPHIPTDRALP